MSSSMDEGAAEATAASSSSAARPFLPSTKRSKHHTSHLNKDRQNSHRSIIELTEIDSAPRTLALRYGICIPCREQISRCDGHDNYTKACTQCRKRGDRCIWKLARSVYRKEKQQQQQHDEEEEDGASKESRRSQKRRRREESSSAGEASTTSGAENDGDDDGSSSAVSGEEEDKEEQEQQRHAGSQSSETTLRPNGRQEKETDIASRNANLADKIHLRPRFPLDDALHKGHIKKEPIPSAGWPARPADSFPSDDMTTRKHDKKGKGKAREVDDRDDDVSTGQYDVESQRTELGSETKGNDEQDADTQRTFVQNGGDIKAKSTSVQMDDTSTTREYEAIISQLQGTATGTDYLETTSYTALLRSLFAEESSNLAKSLYWWEFSKEANGGNVKKRWETDVIGLREKKKFKKMSYLERLIVENMYSWTLWPRKLDSSSSVFSSSAASGVHAHAKVDATLDDDRFKSNLPDEILSTTLSILSRSTLPDEILNSMTPTHIKYWIQHKRDYGFPATLQRARDWRHTPFYRSKYAIPPSSAQEYTDRYMNRDELILDIMDNWGAKTVAVVEHAISSVMLRIAAFRVKKGARRPLAPVEKITVAALGKDVGDGHVKKKRKTGKEKALSFGDITRLIDNGDEEEEDEDVDVDAEHPRRTSIAEPDMSVDADVPSEKGIGEPPESDNQQQAEGGKKAKKDKEVKNKKKERRGAQGPGDWQAVLLAAVSVPGLPRRCAFLLNASQEACKVCVVVLTSVYVPVVRSKQQLQDSKDYTDPLR